ncbi:MAG: hypothetical protein ACFB0D_15000 [Phormidesmis sp.]
MRSPTCDTPLPIESVSPKALSAEAFVIQTTPNPDNNATNNKDSAGHLFFIG